MTCRQNDLWRVGNLDQLIQKNSIILLSIKGIEKRFSSCAATGLFSLG